MEKTKDNDFLMKICSCFQSDEVIIDFRNGDTPCISISEELAKMPVWKSLTRDESSPVSSMKNSPKQTDGNRKRRRKHTRKKRDPSPPKDENSDEKSLDCLNEVSSLPAPWDLPYQSPPRTDLKFLTIDDYEVNIDPACSRTESKSVTTESETNKSDGVGS